jgi:pyroglutamyl-peptidase
MIKKILITGFEPFDMDITNPTGDWVNWMQIQTPSLGREVRGVVLPVTFNGGFQAFKKVYDELIPDLVILTGLAKNRKDLTVERIGINWVDARIPDNNGVTLTSKKIDEQGPDGLFTTININELISFAELNGIKLKLSTSAGEYVCNELLYKVLCYTQNKKAQVTFIHFPGLENYEDLNRSMEKLVHSV